MAKHELNIYGDIVPFAFWGEAEYSLKNLTENLQAINFESGDELIVNIHTYGGCTATGFSMYNMLKRYQNEKEISITTRVDGICASIGVVLLLAGSKRIGNEFAEPFVHNAWTIEMGDANQMLKVAEQLEDVNKKIAELYAKETSITYESARDLMNADGYMSIDNCIEYGFYTELENTTIENRQLILNSIKGHRPKNINKKEMADSKIMEVLKKIENKIFNTDPKNKIVATADNGELDFYELGEQDPIEVGAKANFDGSPANGSYVATVDEVVWTFNFVNGNLETKVEVEDETMENLQEENETLTQEVANLKQELETLKTANAKLETFKAEVLNIQIDEPEIKPRDPEKKVEVENKKRTINFDKLNKN